MKAKKLQDTHRGSSATGVEGVSETRDEQIDADHQAPTFSLLKTVIEPIRPLDSTVGQTEETLKWNLQRSDFVANEASIADVELHRR